MINNTRLQKLVLMLLLLVPLGYLAACAVHHTRPSGGGQLFFSKEGKDFLTCEWISNKHARFGTIDIESEPTSSPRDSFSSKTTTAGWKHDVDGLGIENGIGWIAFQSGDTVAGVHQFDLTSKEPAQTSNIDFGESISGNLRMLMINNNLIRRIGEHLEMWVISSGLRSVPSDSRLTLPIASFELVESCCCFRWRWTGDLLARRIEFNARPPRKSSFHFQDTSICQMRRLCINAQRLLLSISRHRRTIPLSLSGGRLS